MKRNCKAAEERTLQTMASSFHQKRDPGKIFNMHRMAAFTYVGSWTYSVTCTSNHIELHWTTLNHIEPHRTTLNGSRTTSNTRTLPHKPKAVECKPFDASIATTGQHEALEARKPRAIRKHFS